MGLGLGLVGQQRATRGTNEATEQARETASSNCSGPRSVEVAPRSVEVAPSRASRSDCSSSCGTDLGSGWG